MAAEWAQAKLLRTYDPQTSQILYAWFVPDAEPGHSWYQTAVMGDNYGQLPFVKEPWALESWLEDHWEIVEPFSSVPSHPCGQCDRPIVDLDYLCSLCRM